MALSAGELASIAASTLDYVMTATGPESFYQSIQKKPMADMFRTKAKTFVGGKGNVVVPVKGATGAGGTNDTLRGYTADDTLTHYNPANVLNATFPWRELYVSIAVTHTELKTQGHIITDSGMKNYSEPELIAVVDTLKDKYADVGEQYAKGLDAMIHGDGTADAKGLVGVAALIAANPTVGTIGGLSRATYTWWRNLARTAANAAAGGLGAVTSATTNGGVLIRALDTDWRQLTRRGGTPNAMFAGSDFIDALQTEQRANGHMTVTNFRGPQEISHGGVTYKGIPVQYDPMMDDLGLQKRCYIIDNEAVYLNKMQGAWEMKSNPSRPVDKMMFYQTITSTGVLMAKRLNSCEVIDIT